MRFCLRVWIVLSAAAICIPVAFGQVPAPAVDSTAAPTQAGSPSDGPAASAKKVWTNEDMGNLHDTSALSTVGTGNSKQAPKPVAALAKNNGARYRNQITRLQAQLPPLDSQIANLKAALSGKPVNEQRKLFVRPGDWQAQLDTLQKRRADIVSRIAELEDQARHAGVPENSLP